MSTPPQPAPSPLSRLPDLGWMWGPVIFAVLWLFATVATPALYGWYSFPGMAMVLVGLSMVSRLGVSGGVIVELGVVAFCAPLAMLDARQRLNMFGAFVPAWAAVVALATHLVLSVLDIDGGFLHDNREIVRAVGPAGIAAIIGGLVVLGVFYSLYNGRQTKCPTCGTWWGIPISRVGLGSEVTGSGAGFGAGGAEQRRSVVSRRRVTYNCRSCAHEWSMVWASVRRETKSAGSFSWTRRD